MLNFWGPNKYKKVINSSIKCLISVKIAIMTPHNIIPLPLVNVWLIFDLQKYVNWLCVFSKVNPFFQKAQVFCMALQPAADPYNVVCKEDTPLYHIFKLIILLFGSIMMFDSGMFLLSFDTDYIGWKHQALLLSNYKWRHSDLSMAGDPHFLKDNLKALTV